MALPTGRLIVNPGSRLIEWRDGRFWRSPVRGRGCQEWKIESLEDMILAKKVALLQRGGRLPELSEQEVEALHRAGLLVLPEEVSTPVRFRCTLGPASRGAVKLVELAVNRSCILSEEGRIPASLAARLRETPELDLSGPILWVTDPWTRITYPFSLDQSGAALVAKLLSGEISSASLDQGWTSTLQEAGFLIPAGESFAEKDAALSQTRSKLCKSGCAVMEEFLINRLQLRALQAYFRMIIEEGWVKSPQPAEPAYDGCSRLQLHNEPVSAFFHSQMGNLVTRLLGEPWQPSYCYFSSYQPGGLLPKHTDREQCGLSASLLVDHPPSEERNNSWPLFVEAEGQAARALRWSVGQAAFFDGIRLPHYREPLAGTHRYTVLFLHFLPQGVSGPLD